MDREFAIVLSVKGLQFPDVDRVVKWLENTCLSQESLHRYLPDGAAVLMRGITSNLESDRPFLDDPNDIMGVEAAGAHLFPHGAD